MKIATQNGYARGYGEGLDKGREDGFAAGAEAMRTAIEDFLDRPPPRSTIKQAAIEWERARTALLALAIGAPDYRVKLNDLSNAEDALAMAVRERANRG
ncbi:MAG: hypothetical protein EOS58_30610 [Mesorhizobium sp.]|nr:MAG: hypothetical protein EOS58_30610 [Mesorhizobium sp.]